MAPQVEADLAAANSKFLQLHGPAGGAELDLYGRAAMLRLPHNSSRASFSRAESEREDKTGGSTAGRIRSGDLCCSGGLVLWWLGLQICCAKLDSTRLKRKQPVVPLASEQKCRLRPVRQSQSSLGCQSQLRMQMGYRGLVCANLASHRPCCHARRMSSLPPPLLQQQDLNSNKPIFAGFGKEACPVMAAP